MGAGLVCYVLRRYRWSCVLLANIFLFFLSQTLYRRYDKVEFVQPTSPLFPGKEGKTLNFSLNDLELSNVTVLKTENLPKLGDEKKSKKGGIDIIGNAIDQGAYVADIDIVDRKMSDIYGETGDYSSEENSESSSPSMPKSILIPEPVPVKNPQEEYGINNSIREMSDKGEVLGLAGTVLSGLAALSKKSGLIFNDNGILNVKPLVNYTVNALGLLQLPKDENNTERWDPNDPKAVLKSMFYTWNPKASAWALNVSREFRHYIDSHGDKGDKTYKDDINVTSKSTGTKNITFQLEHCDCQRTLIVDTPHIRTINDSTCSKDSWLRGPGQKTIGFSFYGNPNSTQGKVRKYFKGIKENLELIPTHYPGWILRLYYDLPLGDPLQKDLCALACSNPNIDLCYVKKIPSSDDISKIFAMNWRFFPALDPQVEAYVSRDLDSRINGRGAAAVSEWFAGSKHFHFMRDHPAHSIEILGSGWGVRPGPPRSAVRQLFREAFHEASRDPMFWADRDAYGPDQGLLKRFIWPWAKWSAISHDAYTCQRFPRTTPFPTRRLLEPNNFVASVVEVNDVLREKCPERCRPPKHLDWEYC